MKSSKPITPIIIPKFLIPLSSLFMLIYCAPEPPIKPNRINPGNTVYAEEYSDWKLQQFQKDTDAFGVSMAIVHEDRLVYSGGTGFINQKKTLEADETSIYFLASISKLFTAISIMQLVEKGKINLDSPITNYIPELKWKTKFAKKPITVRNLLTHHSGLPSDILKDWFLNDESIDPNTHYRTFVDDLEDIYAVDPPNKSASYSNLGYSLLGIIVERVSGEAFIDYVNNRILVPLEMDHDSGFAYKDYGEKMSQGFTSNRAVPEPVIRDLPAGSFRSSVKSMSHFLTMLNQEGKFKNKTILKPYTFKNMLKVQNSKVAMDWDFEIGLGFWIKRDPKTGIRYYGHGGDLPPFHGQLLFDPNEKIAGIILINTDATSSEGLETILKGTMQVFSESLQGKAQEILPEPKKLELSYEDLENHTGFYTMGNGTALVKMKRGDLTMDFMGYNLHLQPMSDGSFKIQYKILGFIPVEVPDLKNLSVKFTKHNDRKYMYFLSNGTGLGIAGYKGEEWIPESVKKEWRGYIGKYRLPYEEEDKYNYLKNIEILDFQDTLQIAVRLDINGFEQDTQLPIQFLNYDENAPINQAVILGTGVESGEILEFFDKENQKYLKYSGFTLEKVKK